MKIGKLPIKLVGLSPEPVVKVNSDYSSECIDMVAYGDRLEVLSKLDIPASIAALNCSFPYPQLFCLAKIRLVCTATAIYEWLSNGSLQLKISGLAQGKTWKIADFGKYLLLTNGVTKVKRDPDTGDFSVDVSDIIPQAEDYHNFNGQIIATGIEDTWVSTTQESVTYPDLNVKTFEVHMYDNRTFVQEIDSDIQVIEEDVEDVPLTAVAQGYIPPADAGPTVAGYTLSAAIAAPAGYTLASLGTPSFDYKQGTLLVGTLFNKVADGKTHYSSGYGSGVISAYYTPITSDTTGFKNHSAALAANQVVLFLGEDSLSKDAIWYQTGGVPAKSTTKIHRYYDQVVARQTSNNNSIVAFGAHYYNHGVQLYRIPIDSSDYSKTDDRLHKSISIKYGHEFVIKDFGFAMSDTLIYMAGGTTKKGVASNTFVSFNPSTKLANKLPNLPVPLRNPALCFDDYDGAIYLLGGSLGSGGINTFVYKYDTYTQAWKHVSILNSVVAKWAKHGTVCCGKKVFKVIKDDGGSYSVTI